MHKAIRAILEKDNRFRPFAEREAVGPRDHVPGAADPLAELERRFDGPVPVPLREAALAGGADELARRRAGADLRVYRGLIRDTIACIRALRRSAEQFAGGRAAREAALKAQLAWYRERRRQPLRRLLGRPGRGVEERPIGGGSGAAQHLAAVNRGGDES
ncbi:MAG: hypothetical protein ACE5JZ_04090 [Kiloniellales bacterium]